MTDTKRTRGSVTAAVGPSAMGTVAVRQRPGWAAARALKRRNSSAHSIRFRRGVGFSVERRIVRSAVTALAIAVKLGGEIVIHA